MVLGFRIKGEGFRVSKVLWFGVIGEGFQMQDSGLRGSGARIQDLMYRVGFQGFGNANVGRKAKGTGQTGQTHAHAMLKTCARNGFNLEAIKTKARIL